jgi:hypothetical protein
MDTELLEIINRLLRSSVELDCVPEDETELKKVLIDILQGYGYLILCYVQYPIQLPLKSHILFCLLCYSSSSVTLSVATTNEGRICSISPESVLSPSMPNNGLLNNSPFF